MSVAAPAVPTKLVTQTESNIARLVFLQQFDPIGLYNDEDSGYETEELEESESHPNNE
jgi:hypothetical protein